MDAGGYCCAGGQRGQGTAEGDDVAGACGIEGETSEQALEIEYALERAAQAFAGSEGADGFGDGVVSCADLQGVQ